MFFKKKRARTQYQKYKEDARQIIHQRLAYYAERYGFTFNRVAIRDTKRSWGSCSSKGNLNFSYKLLFLTPCLCDYVIVHELCHLRQLNHGPLFWQEVKKIIPEYVALMTALRNIERVSGTSLKALETLQKKTARSKLCTYHL